mgnify:CR=1 FL=1
MKITKQQLQQIIKEELLKEFEGDAPYDSYGGPLARAVDLMVDAEAALGEFLEGKDYHPLSDQADALRDVINAVSVQDGKEE